MLSGLSQTFLRGRIMQRNMWIRIWMGVALLGGQLAYAEDYKPGDQVVVVVDGYLTVSGSKVVDNVWPGLVLQVGDVSGEWLWVSKGKPGYLQKDKVIPLNRAAIGRMTDMLAAYPRSARLYSGRAIVWLSLGELDIALADFNEAVRLSPKDAYVYINRGNAWQAKQEYDKAIDDYNEALRLDPKILIAYNNRGNAWQAKQEYDKAIDHYNEALRLDPKYANAYYNRGRAWWAKQDYDKAIDDYNEALRLDPKNVNAYDGRGNVWQAKQEYDKAIDDFDEALRLDPKDAFAVYSIGVTRFLIRDPQTPEQFQATIDLQGWTGDRAMYSVILGSQSAQLLGNAERAKKFLDDSAGKLKADWPYPVVQLLRGKLDEPGLMALATDNDKQTEARCYLGLQELIANRPEAASAHFIWVRDHGKKTVLEYDIAVAELKRLAK